MAIRKGVIVFVLATLAATANAAVIQGDDEHNGLFATISRITNKHQATGPSQQRVTSSRFGRLLNWLKAKKINKATKSTVMKGTVSQASNATNDSRDHDKRGPNGPSEDKGNSDSNASRSSQDSDGGAKGPSNAGEREDAETQQQQHTAGQGDVEDNGGDAVAVGGDKHSGVRAKGDLGGSFEGAHGEPEEREDDPIHMNIAFDSGCSGFAATEHDDCLGEQHSLSRFSVDREDGARLNGVPEPGTAALLGLALATGLACRGERSSKRLRCA